MRLYIFNTIRIVSLVSFLCIVYLFTGFLENKGSGGRSEKKAMRTISYKKDIAPIFQRYCLPCHTEDQMNPSELYLDSYAGLMQGGKHGSPITAGKPDSSLIIKKLSPQPPFGDRMPYKAKKPVPDDTVSILKQWIAQGAKEN